MSSLKENFALQKYNTFGVHAKSRFFIELSSLPDVEEFLKTNYLKNYPFFILGGGSNVLFTKDYEGIIIHPVIPGIEKVKEDAAHVIIKVGSGVVWDNLVEYCVSNSGSGIENLSWIPGLAGASPVQNIGAYGVEIMDCIEKVEGYQTIDGKAIQLQSEECQFSYRNSIFKNELKNSVIITHVYIRLSKTPLYNTAYPDLKKELEQQNDISIKTIRQAIIKIRKNKLPDPSETGNAGSFFKNPIVQSQQAEKLRQSYPAIPVYKHIDGTVKISAAWLIDQSGWKGRIFGNTGTHHLQPLILINRGSAGGMEILHCALEIQKSVMDQFGVQLEMEVNVI
jgi:UDP-N-acetylmuramate dehydrogenase